MKKRTIIFIITVLFTINNFYTQNMPYDLKKLNHLAKSMVDLNPEDSNNSEKIITFLLKYSDRNENPTQRDLDKVLTNLGINETTSIKNITKEEVFSLIYFFINNSERKSNNISGNEDVKSVFNNTSYLNFRDQIKAVNSKVTDIEIQKLYLEMQEKLKNI